MEVIALKKYEKTKFKDSDEDHTIGDFELISIIPAENGYIIKFIQDEQEWQEVYQDGADVISRLAGEL